MLPYLCTYLTCLISIFTWAYPQPVYSEGLLVVYGGDQLVQANADWRGYTLEGYAGGASGISPSMLGRIVWFRTEYSDWDGPYLIVDAVARSHAYESIYNRQEVAEVSRSTAAKLGFEYGAWGYAFFGACPPNADSHWHDPQPYVPPLVWDTGEPDGHKSFYPYPEQQFPVDCDRNQESNYVSSGWVFDYSERGGSDPGDAGVVPVAWAESWNPFPD